MARKCATNLLFIIWDTDTTDAKKKRKESKDKKTENNNQKIQIYRHIYLYFITKSQSKTTHLIHSWCFRIAVIVILLMQWLRWQVAKIEHKNIGSRFELDGLIESPSINGFGVARAAFDLQPEIY